MKVDYVMCIKVQKFTITQNWDKYQTKKKPTVFENKCIFEIWAPQCSESEEYNLFFGYPVYMFQWYGKATAGMAVTHNLLKIMHVLPFFNNLWRGYWVCYF